MKIDSKNIELLRNLSQFEFGNVYYDFHNDFDCVRISLENNFLIFLFKKIIEGYIISFRFDDVDLVKLEFINFSEFKNLTIDNIYRGRFEKNGQLLEYNNNEKSYFYLEFDQGSKMEFWSKEIVIEKAED
ncbi:MAG: hypothetical protein WCO13_14645 [Bacteroidota bacterium]